MELAQLLIILLLCLKETRCEIACRIVTTNYCATHKFSAYFDCRVCKDSSTGVTTETLVITDEFRATYSHIMSPEKVFIPSITSADLFNIVNEEREKDRKVVETAKAAAKATFSVEQHSSDDDDDDDDNLVLNASLPAAVSNIEQQKRQFHPSIYFSFTASQSFR